MGFGAEGSVEKETEIAGPTLVQDIHPLHPAQGEGRDMRLGVGQDGDQGCGQRLFGRGVIETDHDAGRGLALVETKGHAASAQSHQQIAQAAVVAELDAASGQPLLPALRRGVFDAQHLTAAPIDGGEALEDVVHLLDAEGELDCLAAECRPALEETDAVFVEGHVGDG